MGFFQTKEYLEVFSKHFCKSEDIVEGKWEKYQGRLVLLGMKPVLGGEEVTDYGEIEISKPLPEGYGKIQLDYVREDSEEYFKYKDRAEKQEVSPYLDLPKTWDEYLNNLKRKYRKEIKRKIKRLDEKGYVLVRGDSLDEFIRLHRLSDPDKKKFMCEHMAEFFKNLYEAKIPGWEVRLDFLKVEGKVTAGIMSLVSEAEWWLYNSGFDPEYSYYSVGVVLVALSIKKAIEQGKTKYDFLRGDERYKYELGAKDLQLYKLLLE